MKLSCRKSSACVSFYVRIPNPQIERNVKCTHRSRRPHSMPHTSEKVVSRSPGARGHLDLLPACHSFLTLFLYLHIPDLAAVRGHCIKIVQNKSFADVLEFLV